MKTVWVHAMEQTSGTLENPDAGAGGFGWFHRREDALASYELAIESKPQDEAHFFFPYETDEDESDTETTSAIDGELHECCAKAAVRYVGPITLAYWMANKFKMGSATEPALD